MLGLTQPVHRTLPQTLIPASFFYLRLPATAWDGGGGAGGAWWGREVLTTAILIAVVPAVIVAVTLPLRRDAGTLAEGTHRTREVAPTTSTLGAVGEAWARGKGTRKGLASAQPKPIRESKAEEPSPGALSPREPQ